MSYGELAGVVTFRPLSMNLPAPTFEGWSGSPFRASWSDTVGLLVDEVRHLRPSDTILEIDIREQDLRMDGMPRATARAGQPGVILTLVGTPHGDLRYPCSTFRSWQANVRAIALALQALRKVDRYGVTKRGEQYAGWKGLPSPQDAIVERGRRIIREHGDARRALAATHPDRGGSEDDFKAVSAAREAG
jgi:hypothetical protein